MVTDAENVGEMSISPEKLQFYENLLINNLRLFEKERRFDSLCFNEEFLQDSNLEKLFECFNALSDHELFKSPCKVDLPIEINDWIWELPFWFDLSITQRVGAWIVAFMEREVWKKFLKAKQQTKKKNQSEFLGQDSILAKRKDILEFWNSLDKAKRRKATNFFLKKKNFYFFRFLVKAEYSCTS